MERNIRDKISKVNTRLGKSAVSSGVAHRTVDNRLRKGRSEESDEDNLDPLEKATVDDISPRPIRQMPDTLEEALGSNDKPRLVLRDASIGLRGRKVEAFISEDNNTSKSESIKEYSDEEQENINSQKQNSRKEVGR